MEHRTFFASLVVSTTLMIGSDDPAPRRREPFIRYVSGGVKEDQPIGGLARLLHIEELGGRVELSGGFRNLTVVMAAYKDGKAIDLPDRELTGLGQYETRGTITYAIEVVDLDFLPLGDGKKGHCRLRVSLQMPDGLTAAFQKDIPKDVVNLSEFNDRTTTDRHFFHESAATDREAPLVCFKTGKTAVTDPLHRLNASEYVKKNADGSLLLLSLRFNDEHK